MIELPRFYQPTLPQRIADWPAFVASLSVGDRVIVHRSSGYHSSTVVMAVQRISGQRVYVADGEYADARSRATSMRALTPEWDAYGERISRFNKLGARLAAVSRAIDAGYSNVPKCDLPDEALAHFEAALAVLYPPRDT